jgi:hypothetical protein
LEPEEYGHNWLVERFYYPELVETDLATLESLGVNLVSVQYTHVDEAPQLRDFLTRCGRHGIKVNVFLAGANPISPSATDDLSKRPFVELLNAAALAGNPNVFAYDLAWEPIVGAYEARKVLDPLFEAWVIEQYGTVERAEFRWATQANREGGKLAGPLDKQLTEDGQHRFMVAAYRHFLDNLISRRYREVIRLARTVDATHLFGARTGYGGTGTMGVVPNMPFQLTSGAAHLDFISPEGYGYGPKNISDAALVNQYARWAGHGKPVFWAEFGLSVWNNGQTGLERQGELYAAFADMLMKTGAAGWAPWWYPGGYRVDEQSDYGVIAPDRTLRPAAEVMKRMAGPLRDRLEHPAPASKLNAPPVTSVRLPRAQPQGIPAAVRDLSKRFGDFYQRGLVLLVESDGTGTTLGGWPDAFQAPEPAEFVDAEVWVTARENGRIRVTVLNTGEATWPASRCVLWADTSAKPSTPAPGDVTPSRGYLVDTGAKPLIVALPNDVPQFARVELEFADPASATLVMIDRISMVSFGERLHLTKP